MLRKPTTLLRTARASALHTPTLHPASHCPLLRYAAAPKAPARPRAPSSAFSRRISSPVCGSTVSRWSLRLAHDNTFLSYHRNAIIATVAGSALVQYRKGEGRPPLAAAGLLGMGGMYMYIGSLLYIGQTLVLRKTLSLGLSEVAWAVLNATWPIALWTLSLACLLDETPDWLLDCLCSVQSLLPGVLHSSFFLESCQLQPIVRLLHSIQSHEERRLRTVQPGGLPVEAARRAWSEAPAGREERLSHVLRRKQSGTVLTNDEYSTIISLRLERLAAIEAKLAPLAGSHSGQWVPTATVVPVLDRLHAAVSQLEIALEADIRWLNAELRRGFGLKLLLARWFSRVPLQQQMLQEELEAVKALKRRCDAVKTDSERLMD